MGKRPAKKAPPQEAPEVEATIEESTPPPLAFDADGEPFCPPEGATCWRVRRCPGEAPSTGGRPEVVYGQTGLPLHVQIDSQLIDLQQLVERPGLYRLDAADAECRVLQPNRAAYIKIDQAGDDANPAAKNESPSHKVLREAARTINSLNETIRHKDSLLAETISQQNRILARFFGFKLDATGASEAGDGDPDAPDGGPMSKFIAGAMPGLGAELAKQFGPKVAKMVGEFFSDGKNGAAKQVSDGKKEN